MTIFIYVRKVKKIVKLLQLTFYVFLYIKYTQKIYLSDSYYQ